MLQVRESRRNVCLDCNILAYVSKSLAGRFHCGAYSPGLVDRSIGTAHNLLAFPLSHLTLT